MEKRFISLEEEIIFRRALRVTYENEGMEGLFKCMGELNQMTKITAELIKEIDDEEANETL